MTTRLLPGAPAPPFSLIDVEGKRIRLDDFRGRRTIFLFLRFVGCPMCNLATRNLIAHHAELRAQGLSLAVFFESSADNLRKAIETWGPLPFKAIPDRERKAYEPYGVETSFWGALVGMTHLSDTRRSKALGVPAGVEMDGRVTLLPAAFLVGPGLLIQRAHYGSNIGDHVTAATALEWAAQCPLEESASSSFAVALGGAK